MNCVAWNTVTMSVTHGIAGVQGLRRGPSTASGTTTSPKTTLYLELSNVEQLSITTLVTDGIVGVQGPEKRADYGIRDEHIHKLTTVLYCNAYL